MTTLDARRAAPEAALDPSGRWVGAALPRKEDRRMLLGRGRFTGDYAQPGMLHAAFARSPFAAARVGRIDTTAALELPGVAAVFTAADLGSPYLRAVLERDEFVPTLMPMLAGDQVRFAGEPVAVVLAEIPTSPRTPPSCWTSTGRRCRRSPASRRPRLTAPGRYTRS